MNNETEKENFMVWRKMRARQDCCLCKKQVLIGDFYITNILLHDSDKAEFVLCEQCLRDSLDRIDAMKRSSAMTQLRRV